MGSAPGFQPAHRGSGPARGSKATVLIVEDDEGSRAALETLLELEGYEVRSADTVGSALPGLTPPPDWVISDLVLPDGAGEEVLQEVRRRCPGSRVIVVTGVDDQARIARLAGFRPLAVLRKPVGLARLRAAMA